MTSAERLFATKGFNGTSMNDIVKESGFSKGAIYSHFESKERLFLSLWEQQTVVGIDQLRHLFSSYDSTVDKLLKVAETTMVTSCDCPREIGQMQIEFMVAAARMKSLEPDIQKRYKTIHEFIYELFEEGKDKGEFRKDFDSQALTSILFAAFDGLGLHYATLGIEFDAKRLQETLMAVVLEGILAH
jgi:AcrR family transcriptional regulator